jgi:hypothetical protein
VYNGIVMTNSWIGTLVIVLVIAAQVIPAILQAIAKKRAQTRAQQTAQARKAQQIPAEFTSASGQSGPGPGSNPFRPRTAVPKSDEVAARRKAQLDALRNRRDGGKPAASPQVRAGAPSVAPRASGHLDVVSATTLRPTAVKRRPALESKASPAETDRVSLKAKQDAASAAVERGQKRRQLSHTALTPSDPAPMRVDDAGAMATQNRKQRSEGIARRFRQPAAMRQAFILKELLDPPMALRDNQIGR